MPVPNTDTFSLLDVTAEISGIQESLQDCFDDASAGGFNGSYSGSKNSLRNFRDYSDGCNDVTPFSFYPTPTASTASACSVVGGEDVFYHDGTSLILQNGDKIYSDSGGCTLYNGGGSYFAARYGGNFYRFQVSSSGVVSFFGSC